MVFIIKPHLFLTLADPNAFTLDAIDQRMGCSAHWFNYGGFFPVNHFINKRN
jgi:hypothetical protein